MGTAEAWALVQEPLQTGIAMKRVKRDDRHYHGRPKRDRGTTPVSVGTSKRKVKKGVK